MHISKRRRELCFALLCVARFTDAQSSKNPAECNQITRCKMERTGSICTRKRGMGCPPCLYRTGISSMEYACYRYSDAGSGCPFPNPIFICDDAPFSANSRSNASNAEDIKPSTATQGSDYDSEPLTSSKNVSNIPTESISNASSPENPEATASHSNDKTTTDVINNNESSANTSEGTKSNDSSNTVLIVTCSIAAVFACLALVFYLRRHIKRRKARENFHSRGDLLLDIGQAHTISKHPRPSSHFIKMRDEPDYSLSLEATDIHLEGSQSRYNDSMLESHYTNKTQSEVDGNVKAEAISVLHRTRDSEIPSATVPRDIGSYPMVNPVLFASSGPRSSETMASEGRFSAYSISSSVCSYSSLALKKTDTMTAMLDKEVEL